MGLSDQDFLDYVQSRFGSRLGRLLKIGQRSAYPTQLVAVAEPRQTRPRVAVIGNAAHTLHTVAGQGVNLGLRDVAALAELVVDAQRRQQDVGTAAVLDHYHRWRRADQRTAICFTDGLVRLFSNSLLPLRLARGIGLNALDTLPPAKRLLARQAMGLSGRLPRLMLGSQLA